MNSSCHIETYGMSRNRRSMGRLVFWSTLLLLCQHIFISSLNNGQNSAHPVPENSASTLITIPEDLLAAELKTKSSSEPLHLASARLIKRERLFNPIIDRIAIEHEIDPALIKAIIMAESGYNPKAVSRKGAMGLMQLMPGTAESLGVEDIFNPEHNISGGVAYFKRLIGLFDGDIKLALAAYNAGFRKVQMYQGVPPFKATRYYINNVFKYYLHYREQMPPDLKQA